MSHDDDTGHDASMSMEPADDGGVRTRVTLAVPDWVVTEVAAEIALSDSDPSDEVVRELFDDQLRPVVEYNTTDDESGVAAARDLAEELEKRSD